MKTKEVIKELGKMNLRTQVCDDFLVVINCCGEIVAKVSLKRKFEIDTGFSAFKSKLTKFEQEKVFVLLTKLAETDPSEREEEKKYYLRHKWIGRKSPSGDYLNYCDYYDEYQMYSKGVGALYTPQFTQAEINEIKERFNTTLEDFEMVEVEE